MSLNSSKVRVAKKFLKPHFDADLEATCKVADAEYALAEQYKLCGIDRDSFVDGAGAVCRQLQQIISDVYDQAMKKAEERFGSAETERANRLIRDEHEKRSS